MFSPFFLSNIPFSSSIRSHNNIWAWLFKSTCLEIQVRDDHEPQVQYEKSLEQTILLQQRTIITLFRSITKLCRTASIMSNISIYQTECEEYFA